LWLLTPYNIPSINFLKKKKDKYVFN